MIPQPPPLLAKQFGVSRVWPCRSCNYLANSDISCVACPNCGHIGFEGSKSRNNSSPERLQTETQKIASDSTSSNTVFQNAETIVAGPPDMSTLFVPAAKDSIELVMKIHDHLGTDTSFLFDDFPVDLFGNTVVGCLISVGRLVTMQEMADFEDSLNSPRTDDNVADKDLPTQPFCSPDPAGMLPNVPATLSFNGLQDNTTSTSGGEGSFANNTTNNAADQHEDPEIVDPSSSHHNDIGPLADDMSALDIKSNDAKVLEPLDTRYSVIKKPQRFFKVGRVFITLWSEPASSTVREGPKVSSSTLGARIFSETRRFVVVRGGIGYSLCCPIQTYQKRGTTKSGTNLENHAIVYVVGSEPKLLPEEESPGMGNFPIVVEDKSVTIDQSSRLNFGKLYTVEHNVKVRNIGKISKDSLPRLKAALLKSMGVDVSDLDTGTETEDNVSRPTQTDSQPSLHSGDKRSSSPSQPIPQKPPVMRPTTFISDSQPNLHGGDKRSSSPSQSQPQMPRHKSQHKFFINREGIDREVITTDICRYLGNDALVLPGTHKDQIGRIQEGFYITAYRAPTTAQLADLRADSQKWREEKQRNSARHQGGYSKSATQQEVMRAGNIGEPRLQGGYLPSNHLPKSYPSTAPSINPTMSGRPQEYQTQVAYRTSAGPMSPPAVPGAYPGGYQSPEYNSGYSAPPSQQGYNVYSPPGVPSSGFNYPQGRPTYNYPPVGSNPYVPVGYGRAESQATYGDPYVRAGVPQQPEPQGDYYDDDEMDYEEPPSPAPAPAAPIRRRERDSRERHDEPRRRDRSYR